MADEKQCGICERCRRPRAFTIEDFARNRELVCGYGLPSLAALKLEALDNCDRHRVNWLEAEVERLNALINSPHVNDFLEAVRTEAAHQCERWGVESDAGKGPTDWFWLLGFLAGKAVWAATHGDREKALHHTISSAAVLLNWHAHMSGERTRMRPGIEEPKEVADG